MSDTTQTFDTNWLPWLGCWQLWEEQRGIPGSPGRPFSSASEIDAPDDTGVLLGQTLVCVTPSETGGVELTATAGESALVDRTLIADGTRRIVHAPGCEGWEESAWSDDGHRLFTRAELACADQPTRSMAGVSFLVSRSTWTDIQVVEVDSQQQIEVRRYNPVTAERRDALLGSAFWMPVDPAAIRRAPSGKRRVARHARRRRGERADVAPGRRGAARREPARARPERRHADRPRRRRARRRGHRPHGGARVPRLLHG